MDYNRKTRDDEELERGISITDPCLGWEDTEGIILEGYGGLNQV